MQPLEEDINIIHTYHEDKEVGAQVGDIFLDLGCTQSRESKFYQTLELYQDTKTMVAHGMLPKDQDYKQFKQHLEALEDHNKLLLTMVS